MGPPLTCLKGVNCISVGGSWVLMHTPARHSCRDDTSAESTEAASSPGCGDVYAPRKRFGSLEAENRLRRDQSACNIPYDCIDFGVEGEFAHRTLVV